MKTLQRFTYYFALLAIFLLVMACGPTVNQIKPQATVSIHQSFQGQMTPLPTIPADRCGAWASNNAPNTFSSITIYAKLTHNVMGVDGATAIAIAHFQDGDVTLNQQPTSNNGGLVAFTLALLGRQPHGVPATVDVSFTVGTTAIQCAAFFTPQ